MFDNYEILNEGVSCNYLGFEYDSRKIKENYIFAAIEGTKVDGHDFIEDAIRNGAKLIIVSKNVPIIDKSVKYVKVPNVRNYLGVIASEFYGWPQNRLKIIGVTGTKGKTTSTYLIDHIMGGNGARLGTIEYKIGNEIIEATNTTPESLDIIKFLKKACDKSLEYVVMEVSSHALEMGRVEMLKFDVALFTNLSQDHLDFHKNMENYFQSKLKIFKKLKDDCSGVLNVDDIWISSISENYPNFIKYSMRKGDIIGKIVSFTNSSMCAIITYNNVEYKFNTSLVGKFNLYNIMGAFGVGIKLGIEPSKIISKIESFSRVPGRFELVDAGQDFMIVVDYAHTDDSLKNILSTLLEMKKNRIITIFGAGGDRDKTKRPKMAKAAALFSDFVIITSDNPRTENPEDILREIEVGFKEIDYENYKIISDRRTAIKEGVKMSKTDDILLIAGKGHENYQILGTQKIHFDDKEEAINAVKDILIMEK